MGNRKWEIGNEEIGNISKDQKSLSVHFKEAHEGTGCNG